MGQGVEVDVRVGHRVGVGAHRGVDDLGVLEVGGGRGAAANFEENSPKLRCWLCSSISPKVAASQKQVVPPLPRTTS